MDDDSSHSPGIDEDLLMISARRRMSIQMINASASTAKMMVTTRSARSQAALYPDSVTPSIGTKSAPAMACGTHAGSNVSRAGSAAMAMSVRSTATAGSHRVS